MSIIETKYFYYREPQGDSKMIKPARVTLCRVQDDQHRFGFGWAICTEPTPHHKDLIQYLEYEGRPVPRTQRRIRGGRSIARGRAEVALRDHIGDYAPRGMPCHNPSGLDIYRYWRPIVRQEALEVLRHCHAEALLQFIESCDITYLPQDLQGFTPPIIRRKIPPVAAAFGDAVELQRMEVSTTLRTNKHGEYRLYADPKDLVYSEEQETFVPPSEVYP